MSRDKNLNKRAYTVRGEANKRKMKKVRARSGDHSRPGYRLVAFCPLEERADAEMVGVGTRQRFAICKKGHRFEIV
jgi:hypothetical protein